MIAARMERPASKNSKLSIILAGKIMNRFTILAIAVVLLSVLVVSGTEICDNAPCESQINVSLGMDFTIAVESDPSTGFEWWTNFDPNHQCLLNSTFIGGKEVFTFNAKSEGNTVVIMLLLQPWENGTIIQRKIFPINVIFGAVPPKQAIALGKSANPYKSLEGLTTQTIYGMSSTLFKNESVMETPTQAMPQYPEPSTYEFSSLNEPTD